MVEALVNFFRNIIPGELTVFILSMMPIIELRGGLVAAKMLGVDLLPAMLICFIGTILPTPFILLFINKIFDWMRNTRFVKLVDRMEAKGRSKFAQIEKYKTFGLLISAPFLRRGLHARKAARPHGDKAVSVFNAAYRARKAVENALRHARPCKRRAFGGQ